MNKKTVSALCAFLPLVACSSDQPEPRDRVLTWDEIEIEAEFGNDESGNPAGLLQQVRDAVFVEGGVAVLDAAPPFIRIYDRQGRFQQAFARDGDGPGEVRNPIALERTRSAGFLITERARAHEVDSTGRWIRTITPPDMAVRGAAPSCNGDVVLLARRSTEWEGGGVLLRYDTRGTEPDTLAKLRGIRSNTRVSHPLFARGGPDGIVLFSEEVDSQRVLQISCDGEITELARISAGPQEKWEMADNGLGALHPAHPPLPAGIALVESRPLWALQRVDSTAQGIDSVTVFTLGDKGRSKSISVRGWYTILDDEGESLLVGSHHPVAHVRVLSMATLRRLIERRGVPADDRAS